MIELDISQVSHYPAERSDAFSLLYNKMRSSDNGTPTVQLIVDGKVIVSGEFIIDKLESNTSCGHPYEPAVFKVRMREIVRLDNIEITGSITV